MSRFPNVDCAGLSHKGRIRPNNEDHFLIASFGRFLKPLFTNLPADTTAETLREEGHALVVADGMGGHAAGEVASRLAIETLHSLVSDTPDWILSEDKAELERVERRMAQRFRIIDAVLTDYASAGRGHDGMGTTLTLAASFAATLLVMHVGDSRAYLLRAGVLRQLTRDHTMAQELMDGNGNGEYPSDPAFQRMRHALTRALGGAGGFATADTALLSLEHGDRLLLCTDGLNNMVADEDIADILNTAPSATDACVSLVGAALDGGGEDNVTVALAHYKFEPDAQTAATPSSEG